MHYLYCTTDTTVSTTTGKVQELRLQYNIEYSKELKLRGNKQ